MDPHKNRIGNCESCLKMRFLVQIPEKCENANSNAKSFKNAKKNASISGKGLSTRHVAVARRGMNESTCTYSTIMYLARMFDGNEGT